MSEEAPNPNERVELHDLAEQLDLTPQQMRDELASGRLAFSIDDAGVVFTDKVSALLWISRRVAAVALFGQQGIEFPLYPCDWRDREHIPGPTLRGMGVEKPDKQPAEADKL